MRYGNKIDDNGNYIRFPGVTVVCAIQEENIKFWQQIHHCITTLGKQYFAPLPFDSYHMTTYDLFTVLRDGGADWQQTIKDKIEFYKALHDTLEQKKFTTPLSCEMVKIQICSVIQLEIALPQDQVQLVKEIAEQFGLQNRVPYSFHITLAYQYKSMGEEADLIKSELEKRLQQLIDAMPQGVRLSYPKLCYFNDMTQFNPWTVDHFPFEPELPEDIPVVEKTSLKSNQRGVGNNRYSNFTTSAAATKKEKEATNQSCCIIS